MQEFGLSIKYILYRIKTMLLIINCIVGTIIQKNKLINWILCLVK